MAFLQTNFFSTTLGLSCSMNVILPEADQGIGIAADSINVDGHPLPVLYLLHGLSDDHTIWMRRTSLERYAATRRLAIVMPAVHRSFYTDMKHGYRYWTFISEELPRVVRHFFHISQRREDTFAAGLSMGGYGALKLGLRLPDRYAAVASLSGAVDLASLHEKSDAERVAESRLIFGSMEEFKDSTDDLFALAAQTAASGKNKPAIFMACGTDDFLWEDNLRFRPYLEQLGYKVSWHQKDGIGHEWGYWDETIRQVLAWLPLPARNSQ
ncbi:MAG: esterase family protein [Ruminococcaceae bacterium]|jgi:S-formylglutathione hydrolase FrmB|nr:esterase family protein [Oscillospiraceae bacterium]